MPLPIRHRIVRDDIVFVIFHLFDRLEHEHENKIGERAPGIQMASVVPDLYVEVIDILLGEDIPHGRVRMVRQVRILGNVVVNELEDVALVCDHHVIGVGETDHRVVAEHRGSDVNSVMVFVGSRVR